MDERVTVCNRCGSPACVGKELCEYDGLPHETAEVPRVKLDRHEAFLKKQATRVQPRNARRTA